MNRVGKLSLVGVAVLTVGALTYFGLIRQGPTQGTVMAQTTMTEMAKAGSSLPAPPTTAPGATAQDGAIFVPPEKQQLIGMRSVPAEMGTLTKEIRIVGKVSYDETRLTHIHSKVSGYIEEVFADSVGKPVRAGEPLFTIYSPDLVATEQDFLLALQP